MSVAVRDIGIFSGALLIFAVVNLSVTFMPWPAFFSIAAVVSVVGAYAKFDLKGGLSRFSSSQESLSVDPVEAPQRINEKARQNSLYKQIDLEKTGRSSTKVHVDTQEVRVDGEQKNFMFGIIGKAKNPYRNEYIAYIYDLDQDRIRKYDSQRYSAGDRIQPFEGKYSWLTARGVQKTRLESKEVDEPQVVIEQNRMGQGEE